MARRVEGQPAATIKELQDVVAEEWEATKEEFVHELVASMPKRCQAVIDANGEYIDYWKEVYDMLNTKES